MQPNCDKAAKMRAHLKLSMYTNETNFSESCRGSTQLIQQKSILTLQKSQPWEDLFLKWPLLMLLGLIFQLQQLALSASTSCNTSTPFTYLTIRQAAMETTAAPGDVVQKLTENES
jgi:hypothetical protein